MGAELNSDNKDECLVSMADVGTHRHEFLQHHVSKMHELGIDCEWVDVEEYVLANCADLGTKVVKKSGYEYKCFNEKYNMSFLCDGIIKYKGTYYILEIKTESSFKWSKRTNVDDKHKPQACCYSLCFGISKVIFVYENRDTCSKKAYLYKPSQHEIEEQVLDKITKCNEYVDLCVTPPKTENKRDCAYCNYIDICKKEK
jgi:CRISPR/Cas system-associated exonuclease Cas4 (RecB family)